MCKISIVMSTYNETGEELKDAINSILGQTFKDYEYIIVLDNPNNEEHKIIVEKFANQDSRIKYIINKENIGLASSLNKGIDLAKGKYIARMDADDISMPERLEKEYNFLEGHKEISIVSTNKIIINQDGKELYKAKKLPTQDKYIKKLLKYMSVIVHPSVMFRKEDIIKLNKYRNFKMSQDYDLWMRAYCKGLKFGIINEYLIKYRVRDNNISNSNPIRQWIIHEYILKLYKQRIKKGTDQFSEKDLEKYLQKEGANDEKQKENFKRGMNYIEEFKSSLRDKKYMLAICFFIKSICSQKKIIKVWYSYIRCSLIKRTGE